MGDDGVFVKFRSKRSRVLDIKQRNLKSGKKFFEKICKTP